MAKVLINSLIYYLIYGYEVTSVYLSNLFFLLSERPQHESKHFFVSIKDTKSGISDRLLMQPTTQQ